MRKAGNPVIPILIASCFHLGFLYNQIRVFPPLLGNESRGDFQRSNFILFFYRRARRGVFILFFLSGLRDLRGKYIFFVSNRAR